MRKFIRDVFHKKIQSFGFYQLQKALLFILVIVKKIEFLVEIYDLKHYVRFNCGKIYLSLRRNFKTFQAKKEY